MAEENQSKDFFKALLTTIKDIVTPGINLLGDPAARTEFLSSLGLSDSSGAPPATSTTSLDEYITSEAKEVDVFKLASAMADLTQLILGLEGFFRSAASANEDPEFAAGEAIGAFTNIFIWDYIRRRYPVLHSTLNLLNVIDNQTAAEGGSYKFIKDTLLGYFKRLGQGLKEFNSEEDAKAVSDSIFLLLGAGLFLIDKMILEKNGIDSVQIQSAYGFEGAQSSTTPVADAISNRAFTYSITVTPLDDPDNVMTMYNSLALVPKGHGGISLLTDFTGQLNYLQPIDDTKSLKFDASGEGIFRIGNAPEAEAGKNNQVSVTFKHERSQPAMWSLLDKPAIKLGFGTYSLGFKIVPDDLEIKAKFEMPFQFGRGGLSGFPFDMLPENVDEKIPIAFGYSLKRSFFFGDGSAGTGSSNDSAAAAPKSREVGGGNDDIATGLLKMVLNAIDLRIPLHKNIGNIIGFEVLNVKTGVEGSLDKIHLETSLDFWLKFGPVLTLSVSRLGMLLELDKRTDDGGIFGYDLLPKIKPPNGIGVRVNAGVIKGGGFLYIDEPKGEYFGSLELEFKGLFSLKAVGLINTIMPDGTKGFSLIIIITAEFAPIQLGFGFTLLGVGGLLGLNRTVDVETLRLGIRTNAIKSVLFPEDVIGNISRIISDLRRIFPVKQDSFLIGLMGEFGYGTPTLIKIELGFIVQLPDPKILLLGVISMKLPTEDAAILKLQVNFLGVLDFQNKFIYFEAALFDSMLVGFTLTGSMAFAVAWGEQSVFAISIGGFHPDFKDYPTVPTLPGAFRDMVRIGLSLLSGDNPRLTIELYLAVTSNTLQFGAKLELLASGPMGFNLYGLLAFDALFIFDPFSFIITLEATLAIRRGTSILFGIHFKGTLSGTNPWHIEGEVSFSLLFFDVTIGFSATWGDPPPEIISSTADLLKKLIDETGDIRNWRAELPETQSQQVTHRNLDDQENPPLVIYPFGELRFSQRTIPLNYKMDKYSGQKPLDANQFTISKVTIGDEQVPTDSEKEMFASGNFTNLNENEKLSRKSFERLDSGFILKDSGKLLTAQPHLSDVDVIYELNYTSDDKKSQSMLSDTAFRHMTKHGAASKSTLSWYQATSRALNGPEKVVLQNKDFAIANTSDLTDSGSGFRATSIAEAKAHYNTMLFNNPELADKIQIVESFELIN